MIYRTGCEREMVAISNHSQSRVKILDIHVQKPGYGKYDNRLRLTTLAQCMYKYWPDSFNASSGCVPAGLNNARLSICPNMY
jgi:hypothetical protein